MLNMKKVILTLALLVAASSSIAQTVKTASDIDSLQMQRTYYEALAATNKAKNEAEAMQSGSTSSSVPQVPGQMMSQNAPAVESAMPSVTKITGGLSGMRATISTSSGESTYSVGETIPGGYKILNISLKGVQVEYLSSGKKLTLN